MSYSTLKNAKRAAKKQGLVDATFVQEEDKWIIVSQDAANENVEAEVEAEAEVEVEAEPVGVVLPTEVATPFAFIWAFLDANPMLPRKSQIAALIACGYNANTVKTQVSRYNKVDGNKSLWLSMEKAKRDAERAKIEAMVVKIRAEKAAAETEAQPSV